ncbi:hypothetical protein D3C81_1422090 [compost metagenome]
MVVASLTGLNQGLTAAMAASAGAGDLKSGAGNGIALDVTDHSEHMKLGPDASRVYLCAQIVDRRAIRLRHIEGRGLGATGGLPVVLR